MARYFFHLHNDKDTIDENGSEHPDDSAAIAHGRSEAFAMAVASLVERKHIVLSHRLIVADQDGREVTSIRFGDVLDVRD